jgi:hypothetical protein
MLVYQRVLSIFNMQCCIHLYPKYADPFRADLWQEFERKFREQNVPRAPADADLPPGSKGGVGSRPQMRPELPKIKKIRDVDQFSYGSMMISRSWSSFNGTDWLFLRVVPSSTHFWTIDDIVSIFKRMTLEPEKIILVNILIQSNAI